MPPSVPPFAAASKPFPGIEPTPIQRFLAEAATRRSPEDVVITSIEDLPDGITITVRVDQHRMAELMAKSRPRIIVSGPTGAGMSHTRPCTIELDDLGYTADQLAQIRAMAKTHGFPLCGPIIHSGKTAPLAAAMAHHHSTQEQS